MNKKFEKRVQINGNYEKIYITLRNLKKQPMCLKEAASYPNSLSLRPNFFKQNSEFFLILL